jgi:hypothetical protein
MNRVVQLVGGPHCGRNLVVGHEEQEARCGRVRDMWGFLSETSSPSQKITVGVYRPRNSIDAAVGRWTWKEPA